MSMLSQYRQGISEARTLAFLIDVLAEHGDRQAVLALQEEGAKSWSYDELAVHVRRLAHGLTKDGWFRTRDLGHFDEDGYLYVTGRASTLIVTEGGKNIQPEEVEEAYLGNPIIREIGVLQRDGRLVAVIVPDLDEIRRRVAEIDRSIRQAVEEVSDHLPSYQRISEYAITHLPLERTQLGKIRRHLLEERFDVAKRGAEGVSEAVGPISIEEMLEADRTLLENPAAREVWELLAKRYSDQLLTPDTSPQLDLGIDSLGWMDLTLEIDQSASVELSEEAIGRIYTVRELLN
jgi:long-chain acyl-CoA synthetase